MEALQSTRITFIVISINAGELFFAHSHTTLCSVIKQIRYQITSLIVHPHPIILRDWKPFVRSKLNISSRTHVRYNVGDKEMSLVSVSSSETIWRVWLNPLMRFYFFSKIKIMLAIVTEDAIFTIILQHAIFAFKNPLRITLKFFATVWADLLCDFTFTIFFF